MNCESFHVIIKNARQMAQMTQTDLAFKLGVSGAYIAKLEKGQYCPSPSFVTRIAAILNLDLLDLFLASLFESKFPEDLLNQLWDLRQQRILLQTDPLLKSHYEELCNLSPDLRAGIIEICSKILKLRTSVAAPP